MSYILDALRKSQEQRELGRVPTLSSGASVTAGRTSKANPWTIAAVGLAAIAVVIALYAALGSRIGEGLAPKPLVTAATPEGNRGVATAGGPVVGASPGDGVVTPSTTLPAVPPAAQPAETAQVARRLVLPPASEEYAPMLDEAALMEQVQRFEAGQVAPPRRQEPEAPRSAFSPGSRPPGSTGGSVPPDLRREILEFKQKALRETGKKERVATKAAPVPTPSQAEQPIAQPPAPEVAPRQPEVAPAPKVESRPAGSPLPPAQSGLAPASGEGAGKSPSARVTVHVYSEDPAKRFVIIKSLRLREGDRTDDGLVVEEIRPDGVVLSAEGQRVFRPR
jgi:general secretion pathway protein B